MFEILILKYLMNNMKSFENIRCNVNYLRKRITKYLTTLMVVILDIHLILIW
jgi:hypothetical protein